MSRFNPARTSSPLVRPRANTVSTPAPAPNRNVRPVPDEPSTSSVQSLQQITLDDVQVIDAIIERAPATAKAFVAVYKAYNAVLQERGLDPSEDVVYYEFLLKIGLFKGAEWGDKWAAAKAQLNLGGMNSLVMDDPPPPSPSPPSAAPAPLKSLRSTPGPSTQAIRTPRYRARFADDTQPASDRTPTITSPTEAPEPSHASANLQRLLRKLTAVDSSSTSRTETSSIATPSSRVSNLATARPVRGREEVTPKPAVRSVRPTVRVAASLDGTTPSRAPLGYRSRFTTPDTPAPPYEKATIAAVRLKREESVEPAVRLVEEPPRRKSNNEPDTWRLIKMDKDADHFRSDKLLEKFFSVWRQNAQWIRDTTEQISEARRKLALRERFTQWQEKTQTRADMTRRAARVDAYFTQRRVFLEWRQAAAKRRRHQWQVDMKKRLRTVRSMVDQRLLRQVWERWRQSRESTFAMEQAQGFYDANVLHRSIVRWSQRLQKLRVLPIRALEFRAVRNKSTIQDMFETWKSRAELRVMERMTQGRRDERIRRDAFVQWRVKMQSYKVARELHEKHILRSAFATWRASAKRVRTLERRGRDYVRRQDRILLQAVNRVWVAKARGEQLTRMNRAQLLRDALFVWRNRVIEVQSLEGTSVLFQRTWVRTNRFIIFSDKALALVQQADKDLLARAFHVIRGRVQTFREEEAFATQQYQRHLLSSALVEWREVTALRRKQARQARIARRFFVERSAFGLWRAALVQKRLEGVEAQFKKKKLGEAFQVWRAQLKRQTMLKRTGDAVQSMVEQRITYDALKTWIGAVVENKLQLLQAVDERNQRLQRLAFDKWKVVKRRHQEDMSLLRSFQDVKREEMIRRAFLRWLSATRHEQHRRQRLERKEQQIRLDALGRAWDIWRDKYKEQTLRVPENLVRLQAERSLVFGAFRLWESRSKSLPALRLYANNVRRKAFEKWKASLPSAKLARVAREVDKEKVLRKMLMHWRERYQTKIGLKAVARARYLRLPPAAVAPRPSVLSSAAASRAGPSSRPGLPTSSTAPPVTPFPRASAVSLLGRKAASERAPSSVPDTRAPSPVATVARARSRSPVRAAQTPKPAVATPAPLTRASLLSGFRVTPRPTRAGTLPSAPPSTIGETMDMADEDTRPVTSTPLSARPSRLVGRRFAR